jgi:hypothetical protein
MTTFFSLTTLGVLQLTGSLDRAAKLLLGFSSTVLSSIPIGTDDHIFISDDFVFKLGLIFNEGMGLIAIVNSSSVRTDSRITH